MIVFPRNLASINRSFMKLCLVSYGTNHRHPGAGVLARSAMRWKWDLKMIGHGESWQGFKSKFIGVHGLIPSLRDQGYTHLVFADCYDSLVVGPPEQFGPLESAPGIVWSCEKACWPPPVDQTRYPKEAKSEWRFLNSGGYFGSLDAVEKTLTPMLQCEDDQWASAEAFLDDLESGKPTMRLDDGCEWFQTLGHVATFGKTFDSVFSFDGKRFTNKQTCSVPAILHGNGTSGVEWFSRLTGDL